MEGFAKYIKAVERTDPIKYVGRVTKVLGLLVESHGPQAVIGEICQIVAPRLGKSCYAEVVGLREDAVQLMVYEGLEGIEVGSPVIARGISSRCPSRAAFSAGSSTPWAGPRTARETSRATSTTRPWRGRPTPSLASA